MNPKISLSLVFGTLLLVGCPDLSAQPGINIYTDFGENNVSQGLFIKTAGFASYKFGKYLLESGFQLDLKNTNNTFFSGFSMSGSRNFKITNFPLEITGFWISTPFSELLRETNWGARLNRESNHFEYLIGAHFRTYAFRQKAIREYGIGQSASKIHETMNLLYSVGYQLKPRNNSWNAGILLTNYDNFMIEQETNPMLRLNGLYKLSSPLIIYLQAWYKSAGATNLAVNYFGFFFRTGIIWNIRCAKD